MNYGYTFILVAFLCFHNEGGISAQSRFKAGLMTGLNFSQIHGDRQDGFKKKGKSLGLTGSMVVLPDLDICTELLYNEKGSALSTNPSSSYNHISSEISLKYSEMALMAHYYFRPLVAQNYYEQSLKIGLSYGRLLKSQTTVIQNQKSISTIEQALTQNYNRNDVSFIGAWAFYLSPRFGVSLRYTSSLNFLLKTAPIIEKNVFINMRPSFFTFHLTYDFIAPKKVVVVRKRKKARFDPLEEL